MSRTNRSVDRGLHVLQVLGRLRRPVRFSELVEMTSIPKATLHGVMASLASSRFVEKSADGYHIGITAFEVGTAMPASLSLRDAVGPALDRLAASTGESCHFGMLVGTDVVYLDRRDTGDGLRFASRIGQRLPAHATGLGKAMLALVDDKDLAELYPLELAAVTTQSLTTRAELFELVHHVRARGHAVESEESTPGVCCIGVAVRGPHCPLGLSVTVPVQRATVVDLPRYLPALQEAIGQVGEAARVSGWHGAIDGQTGPDGRGGT